MGGELSEVDGAHREGQPLVLLGGGGHASDVLAMIEFINRRTPTWTVVGIADDSPEPRLDRFEGRGVAFLGTIDHVLESSITALFIGTVGFPEGRRIVAERAERAGLRPATLIDPRAAVDPGARIGEGSVVMEGVHLSPLCQIGRHTYLGTKAMIGHDVRVGDYTSILPHSCIGGDSVIEDDVLIGLNATVIYRLRVGRGACVGAGAVVVRDVDPDTTVVGVPARPIAR